MSRKVPELSLLTLLPGIPIRGREQVVNEFPLTCHRRRETLPLADGNWEDS